MSHANKIYDSDPHFSISPITRLIKNESSRKTTLIQNDHNSERFSFSMERFVEGHDMTECNRVEIHFVNGTNKDIYTVDDLRISPEDENTVVFTWLLEKTATRYEGKLEFAVCFACVLADETVDYAWNTAICDSITIKRGMNNTAAIVDDNPDMFNKLKYDFNVHKADFESFVQTTGFNFDFLSKDVAAINKAPDRSQPNGDIFETNTGYHLGEQAFLRVEFPSEASDGDMIYLNFYSGEIPTNFWMITTNTSDMELIPDANTGYEIYARYVMPISAEFTELNGKWIVNYSEYTIGR